MERIHFFEIEDQPWCPTTIRDGATTFLQWVANFTRFFDGAAPILGRVLDKLGHRKIVDLCSGGGGPWFTLARTLGKAGVEVEVSLTDLYPNRNGRAEFKSGSGGKITYYPHSVNAFDVPSELTGCRTIFNGFHHFAPEQAGRLLQDAVDKKQGIAIFEMTSDRLSCLLNVIFVPIVTALSSPFWRPFRWTHVFFSLFVPLIPVLTGFDGIVSALRIYTPDELRKLIARLERTEGYTWEVGNKRRSLTSPLGLTYLVGYPVTHPHKCVDL